MGKKRRRVKRGFDAIFNAEESSQLEEDNKENSKLSTKQLKDAIDAFSTEPSSSEGEEEEELLIPRKRAKSKKLLFTNDNAKLPSSTPLTHRSKPIELTVATPVGRPQSHFDITLSDSSTVKSPSTSAQDDTQAKTVHEGEGSFDPSGNLFGTSYDETIPPTHNSVDEKTSTSETISNNQPPVEPVGQEPSCEIEEVINSTPIVITVPPSPPPPPSAVESPVKSPV